MKTNVNISEEMKKFAEEYALWIITIGQKYINALSTDFTTNNVMNIFISNYYGKDWKDW